MVPHAFTLVAALARGAAQVSPQIQVILQQASDPWWKWLFQFILDVIPVAGGVWIAVWSFRAASQRDHKQWVLDHKREEWSVLLKSAAEMQRVLRMESMTPAQRARDIADKLKFAAHELSIASQSCVFLLAFFSNDEKAQRFFSFLQNADKTSQSISGLISLHNDPLPNSTPQELSDTAAKLVREVDRITNEYLAFCAWLRKEATISLGVPIEEVAKTSTPSS